MFISCTDIRRGASLHCQLAILFLWLTDLNTEYETKAWPKVHITMKALLRKKLGRFATKSKVLNSRKRQILEISGGGKKICKIRASRTFWVMIVDLDSRMKSSVYIFFSFQTTSVAHSPTPTLHLRSSNQIQTLSRAVTFRHHCCLAASQKL